MKWKNRQKIEFLLVGLVVILLMVTIWLSLAQTLSGSTPALPLSTQQPPIYPNASNLQTDYTSAFNVKTATFQTSDDIAAVQSYYRNILQNDGWTINNVSKPATPDSLYLIWNQSSTGYDIQILISPANAGKLDVKIRLVAHNLFS